MQIEGTTYDDRTPEAVLVQLEFARRLKGRRIRIRYGTTDPDAPDVGRDWLDEHDVEGTIGRSTGTVKVPLLIPRGGDGGPALLDHCIVRIIDMDAKRVLYSHPRYHRPALTLTQPVSAGYAEAVAADGKLHAQFKKPGQAARWIKKMSL